MLMRLCPFLVLILILGTILTPAFGYELQPLVTRDFSPATIGFGLPTLGAARTLPARSGQAQLDLNLASNSDWSEDADETLLYDGETYRIALSADYGLGSGMEFGIELPLISHQGGFLDNFIEGWHDFFGLPQGGRDQTAHNQLDYSYTRQNGEGFSLQSKTTGIGDLTLRGGWQYWEDDSKLQALALRVSLKLPTGSAEKLTGSGSTDLAIWLSGEKRRQTTYGQLFFYGGGGGILSGDGKLLSDQRRNLVGFISLGCGWQPWTGLGLQLQFDGHTPFYSKSDLPELTNFSGQLVIGGSLSLAKQTVLELAVIEDLLVQTAPDVVFHLALRQRF
jgi:hypothetical protein